MENVRPDGARGPHEPFSVANLLKAQQKLLLSGRAPPPRAGPVPDEARKEAGGFRLQEYIQIVSRRWVYVAIPLIFVPVLATLYAHFQEDEYRAASRILLTRNIVGHGVADDLFASGVYVTGTALSKMATLESVRERAAEMILEWASGRDDGPLGRLWAGEGGGRLSRSDFPREAASKDVLFEFVTSAVEVLPDRQNVSVELGARSTSRVLAAAASDALASAIVEDFEKRRARQSRLGLLESHIKANRRELEEVNEKIAELRREAAEANEELEGFPLELERQYELLKDYLLNLRSVEFMIKETECAIGFLESETVRVADDVPPPENLITRLIDLEIEHDQLASRYRDQHPKMRSLREDTERTRRAIEEHQKRRKDMGGGGRQYSMEMRCSAEQAKLAGLTGRREQLTALVGSIRREIQKASAQERSLKYELRLTERQVLQDTAVALRTRLQRAELAEGKVLEVAPAEVRRAGPQRWQTTALGVFVGMLAGVLLALLAEHLDETVRMPAEIRAVAGLPTLQVLPSFTRSLTVRPEETTSGIANVFAVMRNHIRYSAPQDPEKCLLITSAAAGEGKSLVAVNLAISFAQEGNKTLLVDGDVQKAERHAMAEAVSLAWEPGVGLGTYLEGTAELDQVLTPSLETPQLFFISSGGRVANAPKALRSDRASHLFARLAEDFDVVIVDGPPVLPVVDATIIAGYCRSVLHVVRYGYTRRHELEESVRRLRHVGAPLVGVVLNDAKGAARSYYGGYRYRYPAGQAI